VSWTSLSWPVSGVDGVADAAVLRFGAVVACNGRSDPWQPRKLVGFRFSGRFADDDHLADQHGYSST
ncbi:MAG: hypothetical protein J2P54_24765, partial [Bradyrhizobiaceae bacterium]|nr:hypothetical protein [Bradyrhizobiaceae bacterium]